MSEIQIKIGDQGPGNSAYKDGDIINSFTNRMIHKCHSEIICNHTIPNPDSNGICTNDGICQDFFEIAYEFRFDFISRFEVRRTNQKTGLKEIIEDGSDYSLYLKIRKKHLLNPKNRSGKHLFGDPSKPSWYGGRIDFSQDGIDTIWDMIETSTPERKADPKYSRYPMGGQDLKSHLCVPIDDQTEKESADYIAPELDMTDPKNPIMLKKRKMNVNWKSLVGISAGTIAKIKDINIPIDLRKFANQDKLQIINLKL